MATPAWVQRVRTYGPARVRRLLGLRFPDDLVQGIDGFAQLIGTFGWLGVGLHRNHQILVSNPQVRCSIAETFTLVKPLGAERAEYLAAYPEAKASRIISGQRCNRLPCFGGDQLSPFLLLLRRNNLSAEDTSHPAIHIRGVGDRSAGRLHPGDANIPHVSPDDRRIPRFFSLHSS